MHTVPLAASVRRLRAPCAATASLLCASLFVPWDPAAAQGDAGELARQLSNPVASLISVPFQLNRDEDFGPQRQGHRWQLNFQPVIPIKVNRDVNVISRTIVPLIVQEIPFLGDGSQSGVADITQSFFVTPAKPGPGGVIFGAGPVILIPTGSDFISGKRWGLGPTAVVLKQDGGLTYGALGNHIWSLGGSDKPDINNTFIQPFIAYATPDAWTFSLNTEASYDWEGEQWSVPINLSVSKLITFGRQPVSIGVGARYHAESSPGGPRGWGARLVVTFLFPA